MQLGRLRVIYFHQFIRVKKEINRSYLIFDRLLPARASDAMQTGTPRTKKAVWRLHLYQHKSGDLR